MRNDDQLRALFAQKWVDKNLVIALPSGKSMEEVVLRLLSKAHIDVTRAHPRACVGSVAGLPNFTRAIFCRPSEIPHLVASGEACLGITGTDTVREYGSYEDRPDTTPPCLAICAEMDLSRNTNRKTRCVVAVRWNDAAQSMEDVAREFGPGGKISIVTEYPIETALFLFKHGLAGDLIRSRGSAETLVVLGTYRFCVVLVETGTTLKVNGLREIATIFESSTVVVANRNFLEIPAATEAVRFFGRTLQAVLNAEGKVYLVMNAPATNVEIICRVLPAMKKPTVQALSDARLCAIAAVVPVEGLVHLKFELETLGAADFVELEPSAVL